jgi:hypothetical protein
MGVVELGQEFSFSLKAGSKVFGVSQVGPDEFESDVTIQPRLIGFVNFGHTAGP